MTLAASWELQKAVRGALVGDADVSALVGARVFDRPPTDAEFPFVTLGDTEMVPDGASDEGAAIHRVSLTVWSRANGRREAKEIMSALDRALQGSSSPLVGHVIVNLQLERASLAYATAAEALRGRLIFRVYTEPTA